jgi:hypothetical protein
VNELLTFVCSATNNSSWENIRDIVGQFYTTEEISDASKVLFQHVGEFVPGVRPSTRVTDSTGHLKNISAAIAKLITEETAITVKFCAVDISRLPRVKPEHINRESMASEIAILKDQMKNMMNAVSSNTSTLNSIQAKNTFAARVAAPIAAPVLGHVSQPSYPPVSMPIASNNRGNGAFNAATVTEQLTSAVTAASSTVNDEIWLQTKHERRRQMRTKVKHAEENGRVMVGSASGGSVSASFPSKILHVSNINKDVSEEALKKHITENGVYVFNVRCVSHMDSYRKSFKVGVKESDLEKMFDETIWAEGIKVREWVSNRE